MKSLVIELQKECLDSSVSVNQVLRKALIIAKKVADDDFITWIKKELNGYENKEDLPDYRKVNGEFKIQQASGLVPFNFESVQEAEFFSIKNIFSPASEIENLFNDTNGNGILENPIPPSIKNKILKFTGGFEPVYILNPSELFGIIEAVKNIVLDWILNLESEGIFGEDLDFTKEEKESVKNITFNINHIENSQIQNDANNSIQVMYRQEFDLEKLREFINEIKSSLNNLEVSENDKNELNSEVNTIESQINSPKPKHSIIRESLKTIRHILEGVAGSVIAAELLKMLSKAAS